MRRLGYQVVDLVVDALAGLPDRPPSRRASPEELAGLLNEPVPRAGADPEEVLRQAVEDVLGPAMRVDHPRFFAYVPIPSNGRRAVRGRRLLGQPLRPGRGQAGGAGGPAGGGRPVRLRPDPLLESSRPTRSPSTPTRGQLHRPRAPAHPQLPGVQAVVVAQGVRPGRQSWPPSARLCSAAAPSCASAPSTPRTTREDAEATLARVAALASSG
jgi:hypothetical protein